MKVRDPISPSLKQERKKHLKEGSVWKNEYDGVKCTIMKVLDGKVTVGYKIEDLLKAFDEEEANKIFSNGGDEYEVDYFVNCYEPSK